MKRLTIILICTAVVVALYKFVYRSIVFLVTDTGTRYEMKLPKG